MNRVRYDSASLKINVALGELPSFLACLGTEPGPQHRAPHLGPDLDAIERVYDDAKYGRPSERPILECTIASVVDPTAPPGQAPHVDLRAVRAPPIRALSAAA